MSTITPVRGTGGATERGHVSLSVPRFGRLLPFFDSTSLQDKLRVFLAQKKNKYWVKCLDLLLGEKVSPAGLDSSVDPALSGCLSDQESPHPSAECVGLGRHFPNLPPPPKAVWLGHQDGEMQLLDTVPASSTVPGLRAVCERLR